jgi:CRISPR-associated endonuclease/helicase Cas3
MNSKEQNSISIPTMIQYWGKAKNNGEYHLLPYHCLDVAAVGKVWLDKNPKFVQKAARKGQFSTQAFSEWFLFFLCIHDIGKFDTGFQNLRPDLLEKLQSRTSDKSYSIRHDQRGMEYYEDVIAKKIEDLFVIDKHKKRFKTLIQPFAEISFGHHGIPVPSKYCRKVPQAVGQFVDKIAQIFLSETVINETSKILELKIEDRSKITTRLKMLSWQLAGLVTLCDWIASGDEVFQYTMKAESFSDYYNKACIKAVAAISNAEIIPASLSDFSGMSYLFPEYLTTMTPLQRFCDTTSINADPQLWILEDQTGSGKTEAALTLASRILNAQGGKGCFIALPTMATSNAMYERMAKVYSRFFHENSKPSLVLSHGARHLSQTFRKSYRNMLESLPYGGEVFDENQREGEAYCSQWLADSSKKALLADVGVGTIDQVLLAGLPVRHQSLRALGMSEKVLIIDEVHAFDAYMLRLLENIISAQAALDGSVILLSATLPFTTRQRFCNAFQNGLAVDNSTLNTLNTFPLVTGIQQNGSVQEIEIDPSKAGSRKVEIFFNEDINSLYELIENSLNEGKCVCWIRNTVADVREAYETLQAKGVEKLSIFHSYYALNDRIAIEKYVIDHFGKTSLASDRRRQILIASQVVEQSLDLDFDVMISDLAPIDLLIQRAGRLHRHDRGDRGKTVLHIYAPPETETPTKYWYAQTFPNARWVYRDTAILWRTKEILKQQKLIKMPEEARLLIESVYGDTAKDVPDVFIDAENESWAQRMGQSSLADLNRLKFEQGYCRLSNEQDKWKSDEHVSTRLSDPVNRIYLVTWKDGEIRPRYPESDYSWDLSALSVRKSLLNHISYKPEIQQQVNELKMQRRFKFDTLFLVFEEGTAMLKGKNERGKSVSIYYSQTKGLRIEKDKS